MPSLARPPSPVGIAGAGKTVRDDRKQHVVRRTNREDIAVAARIRSIRATSGITQRSLASALGISSQQLNKYECGHNRISAGQLSAIARILKVPVARLFGEDGEIPTLPAGSAATSLVRDFGRLDAKSQNAVVHLVRALRS